MVSTYPVEWTPVHSKNGTRHHHRDELKVQGMVAGDEPGPSISGVALADHFGISVSLDWDTRATENSAQS